jgi:hypothetical protein
MKHTIAGAALWATMVLHGADADEKNYQQALSLIDSKQYQEAMIKLGAEIQSQGSRADAAMYWSAYAANKMGDRTAALKRLAELESKFSTSKWMNDAKALQLEINQASGKKISPEEQADEDLKLMAIQGLMSADPERSLPLLEAIVNSPQKSLRLKKQALFVMSQSGNPKAQETVGRIAKGNSNPELQKLAIHNLGIGGKRNGPILEEVYKAATDVGTKKEVLHSFMIMQDRERLLGLAKTEKSEELKSAAIHWLGVSGGREMLSQLYAGETSPKLKREILNGLFIGNGAKELVQVARGEKDAQLKKEAVRYLSMMNSKESADFMAELLK